MRVSTLAWAALGIVAAAGWYLTATRLAFRAGFDGAAPAIGALVATAIAIAVWHWWREDRRSDALERGECPRCRRGLDVAHEHARAGVSGLVSWECSACGFTYAERVTCEQCAA